MNGIVTASPKKLVEQAVTASTDYFEAAVKAGDKLFGPGYAKDNPAFIAAFMKTAASDFSTAILARELQRLGSAIEAHSAE